MAFDLKTASPDTSVTDDNSGLIGADSQSAAAPSWYPFGTIKAWIKGWIVKADVGLGNVANSLQLVASNNLSDVSDAVAARGNLGVGVGAAKRRFYVYNDFIAASAALQTPEWSYSNGGTATGYGIVDYASTNAVGVLSLDLGTTTTGRSIVWGAAGGTPAKAITFGRGRARFAAKMAIHVLSNGTESYTTRVGFIDSQTGSGTNAAFFRYTDSVNGGKWQAVTRDNATETAVDTGVTPVADTFQEFSIDVNAAGTSAAFYIDGALVATITTNIPTTAGRQTSYGVMSLKSAGTTATSGGYVDYIEVQQDLTTAR